MKKTGMMEIAMCNGIILADAKTGMVDLKSVEKLGMAMAGVEKANDYDRKQLSRWKTEKDTIEFLRELERQQNQGVGNMYKNVHIELTDNELIEKYITQTKGRYSKAWGNIIVGLKYATYLNKQLEVEVYKIFVESKILDFRMLGIDHYKELNNAIDTLEDRTLELKPKGNRGCYINISKAINVRINGEFVKGWDEENADSSKTKLRDKILEQCKMLIKMKFIKTYPALKEFIENYEEV